jgi:hypothetical protein
MKDRKKTVNFYKFNIQIKGGVYFKTGFNHHLQIIFKLPEHIVEDIGDGSGVPEIIVELDQYSTQMYGEDDVCLENLKASHTNGLKVNEHTCNIFMKSRRSI